MGRQLSPLAIYGLSLITRRLALSLPIQLELGTEINSRLAIIHVSRSEDVPGLISFTYGAGEAKSDLDTQGTVASTERITSDSRLVWAVPTKHLPGDEFMVEMARSMYRAHGEWSDGGLDGQQGDRWSEFAYTSQHLRGNLDTTDVLDSQQDPQGSFWEYLYGRLCEIVRALVREKLVYDTSCKVALDYSERFWEKLDNPGRARLPGSTSSAWRVFDLNTIAGHVDDDSHEFQGTKQGVDELVRGKDDDLTPTSSRLTGGDYGPG
ncbi:L-amino acid oxidase [Metarhizium album ARSEF 1941]|uniref:L-amino acid oxidase n=1 Tax=Metarhizium album (strain ARSEF 1941) TaxID=1081103 RepID=A0A0B2WMK6_METAS|nr:L-amino acid oxidase [Metarhizium album ARSEF 1941]KHN95183.1 L-amino acid oxidase [Metarhizium album ARSEF 1941]